MPDQAGSALSGAASGAAAGTAIMPGLGTAIGGVAGGLYGLATGGQSGNINSPFWGVTSKYSPDQWVMRANQIASGQNPQNADFANDMIRQLAMNAQNRQAPTVNGTQLTFDTAGRQGMLDTAQRLGLIAAGTQQGAGEMAVNAQIGRVNAAQMAAARSSRGANAALAYRNAMRNQADIGLAGAGQAGAARMQDQAAANNQLGSLWGNLYNQDAAVAAQNAQLGQAAQMANMQARIQTQAQNDAMQIQALGQMLGWDQQTINAHLAAIQQQRADAEKPNLIANGLQGIGAYLQMRAMMNNGQQPPPAPTNPGSLADQFPHGDSGGGGGSGPVTDPGQV